MNRKIIIFLLIFILISASGICTAGVSYSASDLALCRNVTAESNSTGAYLYGYNNRTFYASMLLPERCNFSVNLERDVKSAVISGKTAYALYTIDVSSNKYGISGIDMNTGRTETYVFSGVKQLFKHQFSISDGCAFFTRTDDVRGYVAVYNMNGGFRTKYTFDDDVYSLFNNNGKTYVMLFNGRIYSLSASECSYVCSAGSADDFSGAGAGWICTSSGKLISLCGLKSLNESYTKNLAVCDKNGVYSYCAGKLRYQRFNGETIYANAATPRYLLTYGNISISVNGSFDYTYISKSDYIPNVNSGSSDVIIGNTDDEYPIFTASGVYKIVNDKYLCVIEPGTKVTSLIGSIGGSAKVYDSGGISVTSGNLRSGYVLKSGESSYYVLIMGDVTGEGNVKSNDISLMMEYLVGSSSFCELQRMSADYNFDGKIDNIDLVLISRKANN